MANRSYLYALASLGGPEPAKPQGVCEIAYGCPLMFKILCSVAPRKQESFIFQTAWAIVAEYQGGLELLERFLEKALATRACFADGQPLVNENAWESLSSFFNQYQGYQYFLIENTELYWMDSPGDSLEEMDPLVQKDLAAIARTKEGIEHFLNSGQFKPDLLTDADQDLKDDNLGLSHLDTVLYYSWSQG